MCGSSGVELVLWVVMCMEDNYYCLVVFFCCFIFYFFFFQAEDGIRDLVRSRGLGDVYKRQGHRSNRKL